MPGCGSKESSSRLTGKFQLTPLKIASITSAFLLILTPACGLEPAWSYETGSYVRSVAISSDGSYVVAGSGRVYFFSIQELARKIISSAMEAISSAESAGLNVEQAKSVLARAEEKLSAGMYGEALSLAKQAYSIATDVDQDGVLNNVDFAPAIHNNYIYAGSGLAFVFFAASAYAANRIRERRKIARIRYEREKSRLIREMDQIAGEEYGD